MRQHLFKIFVLILAASLLQGCALFRWLFGPEDEVEAAEEISAMSDEQINGIMSEWGGREITGGGWVLEGYFVRPLSEGGSLTIFRPAAGNCQQFGWTQIIRESLDGEVVLDPTVLPEPDNNDGVREYAKNNGKVTSDGWVVDGNANGSGLFYGLQDDNTFVDKPHMKTEDMENNTQKPNARIYRMEAETCVKCLQPESPYFACFKWYYVHIKGSNGQPDRSFMVTSDAPENAPSDAFNRAVARW